MIRRIPPPIAGAIDRRGLHVEMMRAIGIPAANAGLSRRLAEPVCSGIDQLKAIAAEEDSVDFPVRRAVLSADAKHRALRQMIAQKCRLIAQHLLRTQEIRIESLN